MSIHHGSWHCAKQGCCSRPFQITLKLLSYEIWMHLSSHLISVIKEAVLISGGLQMNTFWKKELILGYSLMYFTSSRIYVSLQWLFQISWKLNYILAPWLTRINEANREKTWVQNLKNIIGKLFLFDTYKWSEIFILLLFISYLWLFLILLVYYIELDFS